MKRIVYNEEPIKIYTEILQNKITRFPANFWVGSTGTIYAKRCIKHLFMNVLRYDKLNLLSCYTSRIIQKYHLVSAVKVGYNGNYNEAISKALDNVVNIWEFKVVANNCWNEELAVKALKWLYTEKYKYNKQFILNTFNNDFLVANGFHYISRSSKFDALNKAFPNQFKPWDFDVDKHYWNKETAKEALKWLYTEKNTFDTHYIKQTYSRKYLIYNGLHALTKFNSFELINETFPNTFVPWDFHIEDGYFDEELNIIKAVKYVIETKHKWSKSEVYEHFTREVLESEGLTGLYNKYGTYKLVDMAYPNQYNYEEWMNYKHRKTSMHNLGIPERNI